MAFLHLHIFCSLQGLLAFYLPQLCQIAPRGGWTGSFAPAPLGCPSFGLVVIAAPRQLVGLAPALLRDPELGQGRSVLGGVKGI